MKQRYKRFFLNKCNMELYNRFFEDIIIPLNRGDSFKYGKFKNKIAIYDDHYTNEKGDVIIITATGEEISACKIRLV